jgi:hypothetical protein
MLMGTGMTIGPTYSLFEVHDGIRNDGNGEV